MQNSPFLNRSLSYNGSFRDAGEHSLDGAEARSLVMSMVAVVWSWVPPFLNIILFVTSLF